VALAYQALVQLVGLAEVALHQKAPAVEEQFLVVGVPFLAVEEPCLAVAGHACPLEVLAWKEAQQRVVVAVLACSLLEVLAWKGAMVPLLAAGVVGKTKEQAVWRAPQHAQEQLAQPEALSKLGEFAAPQGHRWIAYCGRIPCEPCPRRRH